MAPSRATTPAMSTQANPPLTLTSTSTSTSTSAPPNHPAYNLLSRAHSPSKAATLFTDKIKNKPLLLHPSHTTTSQSTQHSNSRAQRRHIRLRQKQYHRQHQKPRPLSAKEKRQLKVFEIPAHETKWDLYRRLNVLWQGYIKEVLGLQDTSTGFNTSTLPQRDRVISPNGHGSLLASADYHGMQVEVVRCSDVGRIGLQGIIVRETRSTFVMVTPRDRTVVVLKKGAVFRVVVPLDCGGQGGQDDRIRAMVNDDKTSGAVVTDGNEGGEKETKRQLVFELHGSQLEMRPVERAVRKFKWKGMDYL